LADTEVEAGESTVAASIVPPVGADEAGELIGCAAGVVEVFPQAETPIAKKATMASERRIPHRIVHQLQHGFRKGRCRHAGLAATPTVLATGGAHHRQIGTAATGEMGMSQTCPSVSS
jgi:hypothetical protein